jgi:ribosome recycling factor
MDYTAECDAQMAKSIENLKGALKTIRSGVVSPSILDKISIDYYGEKTPIKTVAGVSSVSPTQLVVKPYDPEALKPIVAAIGASDLGVNPVINGLNVYLSFPALTGERRQEYVKMAKTYIDQGKVAVRNVRGDFINRVKKDKTLSEDMVFNISDEIQKVTDKYNKMIDQIFAEKQKELLTL